MTASRTKGADRRPRTWVRCGLGGRGVEIVRSLCGKEIGVICPGGAPRVGPVEVEPGDLRWIVAGTAVAAVVVFFAALGWAG